MKRDRTDPATYPETMDETCRHCGERYVLRRMGSGQPWRGGLDYWYTHDHTCEGRESERQQVQRTTAAVTKALQ